MTPITSTGIPYETYSFIYIWSDIKSFSNLQLEQKTVSPWSFREKDDVSASQTVTYHDIPLTIDRFECLRSDKNDLVTTLSQAAFLTADERQKIRKLLSSHALTMLEKQNQPIQELPKKRLQTRR